MELYMYIGLVALYRIPCMVERRNAMYAYYRAYLLTIQSTSMHFYAQCSQQNASFSVQQIFYSQTATFRCRLCTAINWL